MISGQNRVLTINLATNKHERCRSDASAFELETVSDFHVVQHNVIFL